MNQIAKAADGASAAWGEQGASAAQTQFVSFAIGNEQYGIDIMAVHEIRGWTDVASLPKQPEHVRGMLDLRGAVVPIVDLRCRFGQGVTQATPFHIVIIVQIDGRQVGLIGDRVLDIVSVDAADIKKVPHTGADNEAAFISGLVSHDGTMIALIDLSKLLSTQILEGAAKAVL